MDKHIAEDTFGEEMERDLGRPVKSLVVGYFPYHVTLTMILVAYANIFFEKKNTGGCVLGKSANCRSSKILPVFGTSVVMERPINFSSSPGSCYSSYANTD